MAIAVIPIKILDLGLFESGEGKLAANRLAGKYMSREIDWRTIVSGTVAFAGLVAVYALGSQLDALWQKALLGMTVQTWLVLFCFNISHEVGHDLIFRRRPQYDRLNKVFGYFMATPTLLPYHAFRETHLDHHRNVNDPERDPNHWIVRGSLPFVIFKIMTVLVGDHIALARYSFRRRDLKIARHYIAFWIGSVALAVALGMTAGWWNLLFFWLIPAWMNYSLVFTGVAVIPHRQSPDAPEKQIMKIALLPQGLQQISTVLHASHNYHLLHHLYPRVASYHYPALAKELYALQEDPSLLDGRQAENPFADRAAAAGRIAGAATGEDRIYAAQ
ncbi:hypothetical protein GCM10011342_03540 [Aquisalinus flavus]|uniref:Fatty acid desaturase domain-containing protein n=1 Tax=Aquisalinus flavus TaxID=1526572 RepID=A0A8J2V258_9PROT|nr:hypothetical protein GCM10011342_03540 [Aquisalinus flavus]